MVFLDFDDTLIPTTIRQTIVRNLGIDIFGLLLTTELKKLQYTVIQGIEKIRKHCYREYHSLKHEVKFCIVSNAKQKWLDFMFDGVPKENIPPKLSILGILTLSIEYKHVSYILYTHTTNILYIFWCILYFWYK